MKKINITVVEMYVEIRIMILQGSILITDASNVGVIKMWVFTMLVLLPVSLLNLATILAI